MGELRPEAGMQMQFLVNQTSSSSDKRDLSDLSANRFDQDRPRQEGNVCQMVVVRGLTGDYAMGMFRGGKRYFLKPPNPLKSTDAVMELRK